MKWKNLGDANFGEWGGWLIAKDEVIPGGCYGLFLVTPKQYGFYAMKDAWIDLDGWENGRYDPASELKGLADMYGVPVMARGVEAARRELGDEEVARLLLDSGLEDANCEWVNGMEPMSVEDVIREMGKRDAGAFAPEGDE